MKLRHKFLLLAVAPLALAMLAIALAVRSQAITLAQHQRALVEAAYLQAKEVELRHYVQLAESAISPLVASGRNDDETRQAAIAILAQLDYGPDGYFFLYDLQGRSLMHPRQPELVGQDLWALRDAHGRPTIQNLIAAAQAGGGAVRYQWRKPSSEQQLVDKLGYVVAIPQWNWMMGTGIYLDDVDAALQRIDARARDDIRQTLLWIGAIAAISIFVVAVAGMALNVSEHRASDAKLQQLAQRVVQSQEDERVRLSRELHDGVSQLLVSVKLLIETAIERLPAGGARPDGATPLLATALERINHVFVEVRRMSHALRPALLDDLGLQAALEHLARQMHDNGGLQVALTVNGTPHALSGDQSTALYRIAQEALTNVLRHARARSAGIELRYDAGQTVLAIHDNGIGFDVADVQQDPDRGIGLRNMNERMAALQGTLTVTSGPLGTHVIARLPATGAVS
ncbi:cache domain-containing protein [Imbroritus primus]|uniref:cache domain-containing protein n=1 Tax=Imbroritus primus TaxID=3058603 RepID=UPI003D1610E4